MYRLCSRRDFLFGLALAGGATLLAACGTPAPGSSPAGAPQPTAPRASARGSSLENTVISASSGDTTSINPLFDERADSRHVWELIFEPLLRPDPKSGVPSPWLASGWDSSPDGLTWTFHIRPNITWSDGHPFTAHDAAFTFETVIDPKIKTLYRSRFDNVGSLDAVDPWTFRVVLKGPDCPFLSTTMLVPMLPRHLLSASPDINNDDFNSAHPVGTGPFMFKEWQRGDHVALVANPNHWRGRPRIDQWIRRTVRDNQVIAALLKTGEIDYAAVVASAIPELSSQPHLRFMSVSSPTSLLFIGYNLDRPLLQDKRVRQALTHALDRPKLIGSVVGTEGDAVISPIPFQSWARTSDVPAFAYDPAAARQLLAAAGWAPAQAGVLHKDGQPFRFTLTIESGDERRVGIATIAQDAWRKVGIEARIEQVEQAAFVAKYQQAHDFDAIVAGAVGLTIDPDQTRFWSSKEYPRGGNFVHYANPLVDRLLEQARAVPGCDAAARKPLYDQSQQLIAEDQPFTFLYSARAGAFVNNRLQNVTQSPWIGAGPYVAWSIMDWSLAKE